MPRPRNIEKLLKTLKLTPSELAEMKEIVNRVNPEIEKLKNEIAERQERLAALEGGAAPVAKKQAPKPVRKPKVENQDPTEQPAPKRRGRKPNAAKPLEAGEPKKRIQKPRTAEQQAALIERMAKARAARAAKAVKVDSISGEDASKAIKTEVKTKREPKAKKVVRKIMDNDLIPPKK